MMELPVFHHLLNISALIVVATILISSNPSPTWCLPNIRIQVNGENLQRPPYLLDSMKESEGNSSTGFRASLQPNLTNTSEQTEANDKLNQLAAQLVSAGSRTTNSTSDDEDGGSISMAFVEAPSDHRQLEATFSVIKEETIEEMLDMEPDAVLNSTRNGSADSAPNTSEPIHISNSATGGGLVQKQPETHPQSQKQQAELNVSVENSATQKAPAATSANRMPQLPVTTSHLKRPAFSGIIDHDNDHRSLMASSLVSETRSQFEDEDEAAALASSGFSRNSNGPRSRVPLMSSSGAAADMGQDGKPGQQQPLDTLEPSQVMPEVKNASSVPATITRDYGTNTRTRITLGGGYVRNKLPPVVDPTASNGDLVGTDKLKRPGAVVDRQPQPSIAGETNNNSRQLEKGLQEDTRVYEVPERIVVPESVFSQIKQTGQQEAIVGDKFLLLNVTKSGSNKQKPIGKPDSRCPKSGTTTLEHPNDCDKYYFCEDGYISEYVCPNGLMYGERKLIKDYCVHRWDAVCGDKTIPNPISSPGCRWQWGIFGVQGSPKCTPDYYECRDGRFEVRKCDVDGQVYDDRTKSCRYAELVGCAEEALADFKCPPDDQANTYWPFPRYFLNERALIHCVNDKPAIVRCRDNERVDPEHLHCVQMKH